MNSAKSRVSTLALVSSCKMLAHGLQALVEGESLLAFSWLKPNREDVFNYLYAKRVDLLIVVLHVYQSDILSKMQLIQALHVEFPNVRIMIVVDDSFPYLVNLLEHWGLGHVVSLGLPLFNWLESINEACKANALTMVDTVNKKAVASLGPSELCVLRSLTQDLTISEIARQRMRSIKTIRTQRSALMKKLGVKNIAQFKIIRDIVRGDLDRGIPCDF